MSLKPIAWLLLALAVLASNGDCQGKSTSCIPTRTQAHDAGKVDLRDPEASGVLTATLTVAESGEPLSGLELRFDVRDDGATVHSDSAATAADGFAAVDLKQVDASALEGFARADDFLASFPGDATYCSSSDDAPVEILTGEPSVNG